MITSNSCLPLINGQRLYFSINYFTTMSTIMALNELDIDVPRDISVFGFDNYHPLRLSSPVSWLAEQPLPVLRKRVPVCC